jgi:hypothetical protein
VLGVPIAFKARGVNVKHVTTNNNEYIGSNLLIGNAHNIDKPGGIITEQGKSKIGIGTDDPEADLHVSANGKTALQVQTIDGHTVKATKVYNVKWE